MPKNKGKGGKHRRRGTKKNVGDKELTFKEDGQEYAQVLKMLGNGRIQASCFDGVNRLCKIRGKLRKRVWINVGDIVLVGIREFQDAKGDVIQKYTPDEARSLKSYGELPENAKLHQGGDEDDFEVQFGDFHEGAEESGVPVPTQQKLPEIVSSGEDSSETEESD